MFLFYRLILAHIIADFPLQTERIFQLKTNTLRGKFYHGGIFFGLAILLAWPYLKIPGVWGFIGFLAISHILIDWSKTYVNYRLKIDNLWTFLADQLFHIGMIALIFLTGLSGLSPPLQLASPIVGLYNNNVIILYLIGYIISSCGGTFLIFSFKQTFSKVGATLEFTLSGAEGVAQGTSPAPTRVEKYYGIVERLIITTLVILKGYYYFLIPLVCSIRIPFALLPQRRPYKHLASLIDALASALFAIIVGIILRIAVR